MIRMKNGIPLVFVFLLAISACSSDDNTTSNCDQITIIDSNQYKNSPNDQLTVNSLEINDNCLKINFSSGGCSGDTWVLKLIDSEAILESNPPQRNLRLSLKNIELCEAYITKEITFDINKLQVVGNRVLLNLTNSGDQILYEY